MRFDCLRILTPLAIALFVMSPAAALAQEAPPSSLDTAPMPETKAHKFVLPTLPVGMAPPHEGPACATSTECADRLGYGNVCVAGVCEEYTDATDILEIIGLKSKGPSTLKAFVPYVAALPVIGYSPALGAVIGATVQIGMYLGNPETTVISNLKVNGFYTTNQQVILDATEDAYTANNDWALRGDYRLLIYNQETYGLSTATAAVQNGISVGGLGQTAPVPGAQPMDFNLGRIHQSIDRRVLGHLYFGGSFLFDHYWNIQDLTLNLSAMPPVVTSAYAYGVLTGFNPSNYTVSGVSADALFDSRDSTINAYRGIYANLSFEVAPTWLGSSQQASFLFTQFRAYLGLSDAVPRNVLAFWFYSQGVTSGNMPYLALPAIGWDFDGNTGRGYVQGRFRGTAEVYGEAEWRFRITDNGLFGGVVFANAETFSRPATNVAGTAVSAVNLFDVIRPAGGVGLRLMMNRQARTNLRMDIAGGYNSFAIYFGSGEAF
jgi:hypothetical protein